MKIQKNKSNYLIIEQKEYEGNPYIDVRECYDNEDGERQFVSLMLPNMCCDGCVASIQEELAKVEGISEFEADAESHIATFEANKDLDVGNLLDELSKTNSHIEGWSQNETEANAEAEGEGSDSVAS